jgi:hypothetical protein
MHHSRRATLNEASIPKTALRAWSHHALLQVIRAVDETRFGLTLTEYVETVQTDVAGSRSLRDGQFVCKVSPSVTSGDRDRSCADSSVDPSGRA